MDASARHALRVVRRSAHDLRSCAGSTLCSFRGFNSIASQQRDASGSGSTATGRRYRGRRSMATLENRETQGLKQLLRVSEEVADAVAAKKPVVALETTIYTHGALGNDLGLEEIVRDLGAVPAVCGILDGRPTVGLTVEEVSRMVESGNARKCSRRDIAYMVGLGMMGTKLHGGTTIAGTMVLARLAGIRVFGTGGLGGVHKGGQDTLDISADLTELGRTRMAVISAGCKGFLDIPRTLEFLETQGAAVATFADGRSGSVDFPAFWVRDSGSKSPLVVEDEKHAAAMILAQEKLGIESALLLANPIPVEYAVSRSYMEAAIATAVEEAAEKGFTGSTNTPYVLRRIRQLTDERSTLANKGLVRANVARAAKVAVELAKLEGVATSSFQPVITTPQRSTPKDSNATSESHQADILVAGAVALDLSCDYVGDSSKGQISPMLHTSNPACIRQSVGGVGHNVALAAHSVSGEAKVRLCSMIGDDVAGATVLSTLKASGLDTSYIRQLGHDYHTSNRTAQYVAINDADKNLVMAMADMAIFTSHPFPSYWRSAVAGARPKWLVVDGNWASKDIRAWIEAAKAQQNCRVAFEPVSTAKSSRLFSPLGKAGASPLGVFPRPSLDLATPNQLELAAMHDAARQNGYFDSRAWFAVIDALGIRSGARDRFERLVGRELTDRGVPVQTVQLLPYVPSIVTKLGPAGCLLTELMARDDPRLRDPQAEEFILARAPPGDNDAVGGVYMRLFPAAERVEEVVSVNGVGDTFLGVLVAGLAGGGRVEGLIDVAQKAAVMTLKSSEAVSPDLGRLAGELAAAIH